MYAFCMNARPPHETDTTPSEVLVARYRRAYDSDQEFVSMAPVHRRGTAVEFELGLRYIASSDPLDRATGAHVLSQLGWENAAFREESIQALLPLLADPDDDVIASVAIALGHRASHRAVPHLAKLASHPNSDVRFGVVSGLSGLENERAIATLIILSRDSDRDVRDWATFGIGSQVEADSAEIREALRDRLTDEDMEIRGEALVGLAARGDPGVSAALQEEWQGDDISALSLEAAALTKDPALLPWLEEFRETLDTSEDACFEEKLQAALAACGGQ